MAGYGTHAHGVQRWYNDTYNKMSRASWEEFHPLINHFLFLTEKVHLSNSELRRDDGVKIFKVKKKLDYVENRFDECNS